MNDLDLYVITYSNPHDMIKPMPLEVYEENLQRHIAELQENNKVTVSRVEFDRASYSHYLRIHDKEDDFRTRAKWAQQRHKGKI
jgi:hypothetical protein